MSTEDKQDEVAKAYSQLALKDIPEDELPLPKYLVAAARKVSDAIESKWDKKKLYAGDVQTYGTTLNGEPWFARVSEHKEPFEIFKQGLFINHNENEQEYISVMTGCKTLDPPKRPSSEVLDPESPYWESKLVHYTLPAPFSAREFSIWIIAVWPDPDIKEFFVVSIPSDRPTPNPQHIVHAVYTSVEHVFYDEKTGKTKWRMATCNDSRGGIPRWIQNMTVHSAVASDVPKFLHWAKEKDLAKAARNNEDQPKESTD